MPAHLAAIDIGSSGVRCLIFDQRGRLRGAASGDLPVRSPRGAGPLAKELPARSLWDLVCRLIREAVQASGAEVAAIAVTGQREGLAIVDERGQELYLAPNTDLRAFMQGQAIDEQRGESVYRLTGHTPSFLLAPAKLHWLRDTHPELFQRARWLLSLDAWAAMKLGAPAATSIPAAVELGLASVSSGRSSSALLRIETPSLAAVPPLVSPGTVIGEVSARAAGLTGLRLGTPIVAGGPDTQCALLGMGIAQAGDVGVVAGWSASCMMALNRPVLDPQMRTWTGRHLARGWVLESNAADAGRAYRWVKDTLFPGRTPQEITRIAAAVPAGANGALAYLGPNVANMGSVGAGTGGFLFPLLSSVRVTEPADLLKATQENLAYAIKGNIAQLKAVSGVKTGRIGVTGGLTGDGSLLQTMADVLGREIDVTSVQATALGAAMCAATGAGLYANLQDAAAEIAAKARRVLPNPVHAIEYQEYYQRWQAGAQALANLGATV